MSFCVGSESGQRAARVEFACPMLDRDNFSLRQPQSSSCVLEPLVQCSMCSVNATGTADKDGDHLPADAHELKNRGHFEIGHSPQFIQGDVSLEDSYI